MKFFTRAWTQGELDDAIAERVPDVYREYLAGILEGLPVGARKLATEVNVHDGLIRAAVIDRRAQRLVLSLRCGDLESGYFDVDLEYEGAQLEPDLVACLGELARRPDVELLYDEVDILPGCWAVHRLLFAPHGELELRFRELAVRVQPRADRTVKREGLRELES